MKKILVSFIQDRSGSMASVWEETLNGFKTYVKDLQKDQKKDDEVEYLFALTAFDTVIDTPHLGDPIASIDTGKLKDFGPRGSTALYDAVGKTLQALDDNKTLTFDRAIVVIVTDGQENSSREWSKDALHAAIDERIKRGNWSFVYLGTQPETWDDASSLGMGQGASSTYNAQNAAQTYATMAFATASGARGVRAQSRSFVSDNTTRVMRSAVGMSVQSDDDDPQQVTIGGVAGPGMTSGGIPGGGITGGIPVGQRNAPAPTTPKPRVPKPPANKNSKWR